MPAVSIESVKFEGTKTQKEVAGEVYALMMRRGHFMAIDIPIRIELNELQEFLKESKPRLSIDVIERAVEANAELLSIEVDGGTRYVVASRASQPHAYRTPDTSHSFSDRLMTPEPRPDADSLELRPRSKGQSIWESMEREPEYTLPTDMSIFGGREIAPAQDYVPRTPAARERREEIAPLESPPETEIVPAPEAPASEESPVEAEVVAAEAAEIVAPPVVEAEVTGVTEIAEVEEAVEETVLEITTPAPQDLSTLSDEALADVIKDQVETDPRFAHFAGKWMLEERVPRLSRGDVRKLRSFIEEQEQPLTDDVLIQDVLNVREQSDDYEKLLFGLNYRLHNDYRDFEFSGSGDQRFWSVSQLPAIGTILRKPNEIGTDYRFMLEELPEDPQYRSVNEVSHILSFYEFYLGLLPYNAEMQAILPGPQVAGQKAATLTFECPQSYATFLVELRYPTPNRGGYLVGLDDFYQEHLVPGALVSISATEGNDGHFVMEFDETKTQSKRLLEIEERRSRYVFRATSFECTVLDEYLVDEDRFARFSGDKPMSEKARRKPENVIARSFERRGVEIEGGGFRATFAELLAASNVERPLSEIFLRKTMEEDDTGAFARDPDIADAYTYVPGTTR